MKTSILKCAAIALVLSTTFVPLASSAQETGIDLLARKSFRNGGSVATSPNTVLQPWMHPDVSEAWNSGFFGQRTTTTFVDTFGNSRLITGDLGNGTESKEHGQWTSSVTSMIAPSTKIVKRDFSDGRAITLARRNLNVINLSYAMFGDAGYSVDQLGWGPREGSIINYATNGKAVVVKAAGNNGIEINGVTSGSKVDYLNTALTGKQTAIFVGALSKNGSVEAPASLASYSNRAGSDPVVQNQFLTAGVDGGVTGLYGTSFAAPVVSGYAAILGSKFYKASPTQITNQLLNTARQDTVTNYDPAVYGRGEASLSRALAPVSIR